MLILKLLILFSNFIAAEFVNTDSATETNSQTDFVSTCINVCTKLAKDPTPADITLMGQNCASAKQETDAVRSLLGSAQAASGIASRMVTDCVPKSFYKAGVSIWELIQAVGYVLSDNPTRAAERAVRQKFLDDCSKSVQCRRATARQLVEYQATNADGSYKIPDSQVDAFANRYSGPVGFKALTIQVQTEKQRLRPSCDSLYNTVNVAVRETLRDKSEFEQQSEIYNRVYREMPYCPGILQLYPPQMTHVPPQTPSTGPMTFEQLGPVEKLFVGYGCFGERAKDMFWEACSDVGQIFVPIPVGAAAKAVGAGVNFIRLTRAELAAIRSTLPRGHTLMAELSHGIMTRTVTAEGKVSYQVIGKNGSSDLLRMDPSGYAISGSNDVARALAYQEMQAGGKSLMFMDVNNLGLVNYFQRGSEAGDAYLANVAKIISDNIGNNGTLYRWGGDEFVVVYKSTDRAQIQAMSQKISDAIANDATLQGIFRADKVYNAQNYRSVMAAPNYQGLPPQFTSTLSPAERSFAQSNFAEFKARFQAVEQKKIRDSASLQPSVSVGSSVVGVRTPQEALELANRGANRSKSDYKICIGLEVKKYLGRESYLPAELAETVERNLKCKPVATPTF